jgi:hypothetical protein
LIFVPEDVRFSIKKFEFQYILKGKKLFYQDGLQIYKPNKKITHFEYNEDSLICIQIKQVTEMKKDNKNSPYIIEKDLKDKKFIFSFLYMNSKEFYERIQKVYNYWKSNESYDVISNILITQFEAKSMETEFDTTWLFVRI